MKRTTKTFITLFIIIGLVSLTMWMSIVIEVLRLIKTWQGITLFLAPVLWFPLTWGLIKMIKSTKKHIERAEKEKDHFQNIRHEIEKENIKKGKIPDYINFKHDPLLKTTNQYQSKPGMVDSAINALAENIKERKENKKNKNR